MTIPIGTLVVAQHTTERELHSADPYAPQVDTTPTPPSRPALRRTRLATASVLRRAASRVAPA